MARCKQARRRPPELKRSHLSPVSQKSLDPTSVTSTPTTFPPINGTASPNILASESPQDVASPIATAGSASTTPMSKLTQPWKHRNISKKAYLAKKLPFLASSQVGQKTGRVGIQEHGKPKKSIMTFCVDCVRPHLYLYCDGTQELKAHLCDFHVKKPNGSHWTNHYSEIRRILDERFRDPKNDLHGGRMRRLTQPKLKHRYKCGHDRKGREGNFDKNVLAALKKVEVFENTEMNVRVGDGGEDGT